MLCTHKRAKPSQLCTSRSCQPGRQPIPPRRTQSSRASRIPESSAGQGPRVAMEGDVVGLEYWVREQGQVPQLSESQPEAVSFEVGAGEATGNPLFQAFDEAVRGMELGQSTSFQASGGEWDSNLLFNVPRPHDEIQRLERRYHSAGGLREGMLVELANGGMALICKLTDAEVVLDANNMLAGRTLTFDMRLVSIEAST
ncbi:hypothetical protein WJX72_004010 [[Myrmecia] bisecta]|uniref:peptidylprolyl isomerase n=1 Tax=[Myrmecia] bisecta TaxID=41462 RepID=A0AAW1Q2E5_9CHLO